MVIVVAVHIHYQSDDLLFTCNSSLQRNEQLLPWDNLAPSQSTSIACMPPFLACPCKLISTFVSHRVARLNEIKTWSFVLDFVLPSLEKSRLFKCTRDMMTLVNNLFCSLECECEFSFNGISKSERKCETTNSAAVFFFL